MHQQHGSLIALQRNVERVDRFQVQVVGGFVEYQHVGLLQHQLAEKQPRGFSAGKNFGPLVAILARKQHLPQQAANFFVGCPGVPLMKPFEGSHAGLDQRFVVLGEVTHRSFVSPDDFPAG